MSKETLQILVMDRKGRQKDLSLTKTGAVWLGLCPFHTEKTPSFTVRFADDGEILSYRCLSCGESGNGQEVIGPIVIPDEDA